MDKLEASKLKKAFIKYLTQDSTHQDTRRKDYNQAIFDADDGSAIWHDTHLDMVMEKFDKAVKEVCG